MQETDELPQWSSIKEKFRDQEALGLLLGNGASRALWDQFDYGSLYEIACDPGRKHPLQPSDQGIFLELQTKNFEVALSALATTRMVCKNLGKQCTDVEERYESIRQSLIEAVKTIHVAFDQVPSVVRSQLRQIISCYKYVYTMNYDLLLYWAMMDASSRPKDFFWGDQHCFDPADVNERDDGATKVFFLHGALHLRHDIFGVTRKIVWDSVEGNLLSQFDASGTWIPLFVSEGNHKEKRRSIQRNEYLSFALWKFTYHRGPLVIFGSALNEEFDAHLMQAIKHWHQYDRWQSGAENGNGRLIAVSILPVPDSSLVIREKVRLRTALAGHEVYFFDATTHPLGDPDLKISAVGQAPGGVALARGE